MSAKSPGRIIDVTVPLSPAMPVWPGDPQPQLNAMSRIADGEMCNLTSFSCPAHAGTHVDAPHHFIDGAGGIETLGLEVLMGPVSVVDVGEAAEITPDIIDAIDFEEGTRRVLFKTTNSRLWDDPAHDFFEDFVALTHKAAKQAVEREIKLIGVDYLSVQRFHDAEPTTHLILLNAGVILVEGLDLRKAEAGYYDLACLPLKLMGCDGAPARVVLKAR